MAVLPFDSACSHPTAIVGTLKLFLPRWHMQSILFSMSPLIFFDPPLDIAVRSLLLTTTLPTLLFANGLRL